MRLLLLLLGLIAAGQAAAESEIAASVGSATPHLPLPAGYCAVDATQAAVGKLVDLQAQALLPQNKLLGIAMPCDQLAAFRDSQKQFDHYVEFMAALQAGAPVSRADADRAAYFAEIAAELPTLDSKALADTVNAQTQSVGVSTNVRKFGLIGQDEAAAYLASVSSYNDTTLATVSALTAAGGWTVSVNFYRHYVDDGSITSLLDEARHEARAMIAANGGNIANPADLPPLTADLQSMAAPGGTAGNGSLLPKLSMLQMGLIVLALGVVTVALVMLANQRSR